MKNKETLEEVAERLQKDKYGIFISKDADVKGQLVINTANAAFLSGMKEGAKWQLNQFTIEEQSVGHTIDELDKEYIKGFNEGSAYYIERMYSEEEVILIIEKFRDLKMIAFSEWFEQFKKK